MSYIENTFIRLPSLCTSLDWVSKQMQFLLKGLIHWEEDTSDGTLLCMITSPKWYESLC